MINWASIATGSLWLLGVAIILATVSFADYAANASRLPAIDTWRGLRRSRWVHLGGLLACAGLAFSTDWWPVGAAWGLLFLALAYHWRRVSNAPQPAMLSLAQSSAQHIVPSNHRSLIHAAAKWLARTEILWLALVSPFFLFPSTHNALLLTPLLALPILWVARRIARGHFIPCTPLDWALALLLFMVLVSLFATPDIAFGLGKVAGVLFGVALYYALVEWACGDKRLWQAIGAYLLAGGALALLGLVGTNWLYKFPLLSDATRNLPTVLRGLPGAESGFQPNEVGGSLLWVILPLVSLAGWAWLGNRPRQRESLPGTLAFQRFGLLALLVLTGTTLLLTQSRGAWIGAVCGLVLLAWLPVPRARLLLADLLAVGIVASLFTGSAQVAGRLLDAAGPDASTLNDPINMQVRLIIWSAAIDNIERAPITGIGMNSFRRLMPLRYPTIPVPPDYDSTRTDYDVAHAHNQLAQAALDLGLPGLVAYLALWLLAAALVVLSWRNSSGWKRAAAAGIGAALLAHFVFGLTDAVALGAKPGVFFWALLALLVALWKQSALHSSENMGANEQIDSFMTLLEEQTPQLIAPGQTRL